ncbi:MAG: glycyl-radical enzyme activating protein [Deltaproteobacteria bacterium]|nr:glycyl-radical enzyme activating protein [Deltaproteobacteria bacterium]
MTRHPAPQGTILEIQRMSTEDGPGIRTTVFFKGCSLSCGWCHNPESIEPQPQIQWLKTACIGCRLCLDACPQKALTRAANGDIVIDRKLCLGCGTCAEVCPSAAMELLGKKWTVSALADELVKDRAFFETSGGGVTLSGGEASLQHDFCLALLRELRARDIATALDTCGQLSAKALTDLLPYVDVLLYDLKEIDPQKHRAFTGRDNEKILANAVLAARFKKERPYPKTLWLRTPVIPGATDTADNLRGLGDFIRERLGNAADRWELCAFNNLCRDKYLRLGLDWPYAGKALPEKSQMEELAAVAQSRVPALTVAWRGSVRLADRAGENNKTARGC